MQLTADQLALVKYIQERNAETKEWLAAGPRRMAGIIAEDAEHWAANGVYSVEQYHHYQAAANHYDIFKSVHGIRPRWYDYDTMTTEEIENEISNMVAEYEREQEQIKREERETVARLTAELGTDEATLRRWGVI